MYEGLKIANMYTLSETIAAELLSSVTYPWEALPKIGDFIKKLGPTLPEEDYEYRGEDVWVAKDATVFPSAYIHGPAIIGKGAEVRHCAFIRGNAIVGEGAVVGNSTELKNVILFNKVQVPHYNYVGDSILGFKAHMGAGSITSMLGDCVEVGCNSVLNPGTVLGPNVNVYPTSSVRGYVPAAHIFKTQDQIVKKEA